MECRICFEDDTNEPLLAPCDCSGSMRWVHKSCLQKWIHMKQSSQCPVCKQECIIKKTKRQEIVTCIANSNLVTSLITAIIGFMLLLLSIRLNITMNTIVVTFLILIMGIHYIQVFFEHEEINMDVVFDTIAVYTSSNSIYHHNGDGLYIVFSCLWLLVDNVKYKILAPYL